MKVCILAAGRGTRMNDLTEQTNKVLLPLKNVSLLSRIFSLFPKDSQFVVALGHEKEKVREFCELAHSNLNIEFVEVDPFEGDGSGPGRSLLECRKVLTESFFLVCGDTLWSPDWKPVSLDRNFVAVAPIPTEKRERFCVIDSKDQKAVAVFDKSSGGPALPQAFTGLFFIKDTDVFFNSLESGKKINGEHQLSNGFSGLISQGTLFVDNLEGWIDVGHFELYEEMNRTCPNHIFQKKGTFFYQQDGTILKFFGDPALIKQRVERARKLQPLVPEVVSHTKHFFKYNFVQGEVMGGTGTENLFPFLLNWLNQNLWTQKKGRLDPAEVHQFYYDKTLARIESFKTRDNLVFSPDSVNGIRVVSPDDLATQIPWDFTENFVPSGFHGDLILDNIIHHDKAFTLIDWRQSFANNLDTGDLRYDLAKLLLSLELDFLKIKQNDFRVDQKGKDLEIEIPLPSFSKACSNLMKDFCLKKNVNFQDVELIKNLILINIAPLHSDEVAPLLWGLGLFKTTQFLTGAKVSG